MYINCTLVYLPFCCLIDCGFWTRLQEAEMDLWLIFHPLSVQVCYSSYKTLEHFPAPQRNMERFMMKGKEHGRKVLLWKQCSLVEAILSWPVFCPGFFLNPISWNVIKMQVRKSTREAIQAIHPSPQIEKGICQSFRESLSVCCLAIKMITSLDAIVLQLLPIRKKNHNQTIHHGCSLYYVQGIEQRFSLFWETQPNFSSTFNINTCQ